MKAAIWVEANRMEIREIPEPEPVSGEVIIKVLACGVCGTDCHIFAGEVPLAKPPQVLGHEIFGEVIENASDTTSLRKGMKVSVDPVIGCGTCSCCKEGKTNLCDQSTIIGYARTGGFSQYTSVPATHLYPMKDDASPKGGILVETLACVLNGYDRLGFKAGRSALILGAGCVGLLWTQLIKNSVSTRLIQTEIVPKRGETARKLGADFVIDANTPSWSDAIREIEPEGVDYIIDATGSSQAVQESISLLKKGSIFMMFGVAPEVERVEISPYELFMKEITIMGAKMPPFTMERAVRTIEAGLIDYDTLVTTTMPLAKLSRAIHSFKDEKDKHIKIMIDPWLA
jgi:2-desacetyl-2-hydroxyethyl bacteriochlorophyllide A dehydrogenase